VKHTFRPRWRYWIEYATIYLLAVTASCYIAHISEGATRVLLLAMALGMLGLFAFNELRPMWRKELTIGQASISGQQGADAFCFSWQDVRLVRVKRVRRETWLILATEEETVSFSLAALDDKAILNLVVGHAPRQAFAPDAYQQLPSYDEWLEKSQALVQETEETLRVETFPLISFGLVLWFGASCAFFMILGLLKLDARVGLVGLILCVVSLFVSLYNYVEISSRTIASVNLYGKFQMNWDEVEWIEFDSNRYVMVLHGRGKRLSIVGPEQWRMRETDYTPYEMLMAQIEQRQIETRRDNRAWFKLSSRNTRTPWFRGRL
jgi:hypothetical protein